MIIRVNEAGVVLNPVTDPIQQRLIARATTLALNKYRAGDYTSGGDLDMRFFTEVFVDLFADLDVIRNELAGERPGAWFDDDSTTQETCLTPNPGSPI